MGYDILSLDLASDSKLYIEVKTTSGDKRQPFFMTSNEFKFSKTKEDRCRLYRVYNLFKKPRLFQLNGKLEQYLTPNSYEARFS